MFYYHFSTERTEGGPLTSSLIIIHTLKMQQIMFQNEKFLPTLEESPNIFNDNSRPNNPTTSRAQNVDLIRVHKLFLY